MRLQSVDVFRGATVVAMILVNNPGDWSSVYWPLLHAEWHGCTPTDLIFPFFLFIVGVAIVLAFGRRLEHGDGDRRRLLGKIVRRALILFALGLFLSGYPFGLFGPRSFERLLETWRIPGVLQRIAICYAITSAMFLFCRRRTLAISCGAFLLGYWALITLVDVPGLGPPDLDSRGDHLPGWVDRAVFGSHLWVSAKVYDPEGLLSTIPAIATTLFGVFAGFLLTAKHGAWKKLTRLVALGAALTVGGYLWSAFLPLNKALWTSSYATFTAGLAMICLALCFWLFDIREHRAWAKPFTVYGVNAITVFVGSGVLARTLARVKVGASPQSLHSWIYGSLFTSWLPPYVASLAYAIAWILGWLVVLGWMARRGWVLKV